MMIEDDNIPVLQPFQKPFPRGWTHNHKFPVLQPFKNLSQEHFKTRTIEE